VNWGISFAALVLAIILHEVSHGYAALALGDDTAKRMGRLTLNPLVHVDRVGTIIVPALFLLAQAATRIGGGVFFGWAKPVPIAPWRFRDPRRGMMLVALAGPAMNFLLVYLALLAAPFLPGRGPAATFLETFLIGNLALGTFNLLPIPPLDGGRVAVGLLPEPLARAWARLERAGILIVLVVLFVLPWLLRDLGVAFSPLEWWLQALGEPIYDGLAWAAAHTLDAVGALFAPGVRHV
jgi:Zn-dependent protease